MVVIVLTDVPPRIRGDLSKWLLEISTGVYVGNLSARVRDMLWDRVCEHVKSGRATMAFTTQCEQKMDFRIHNTKWEPVDFDGIKLIRKPINPFTEAGKNPNYLGNKEDFSGDKDAGGIDSKIKQYKKSLDIQRAVQKKVKNNQNRYVVIDIETTGLSYTNEKILEIGALLVSEGVVKDRFQRFIYQDVEIPDTIVALTGITAEMIKKDGKKQNEVLSEFCEFIGGANIVCHNSAFDIGFLRKVFREENIPFFRNICIDTLALCRKKLKMLNDYKLQTVAHFFGLSQEGAHRALQDCQTTYQIYEKLKNM